MIIFSFVIPCYNESKGIKKLVHRCKEVLVRDDIEVIFVNNGSIDSTLEQLESEIAGVKNFRILSLSKNKGYGNGIIEGLKSCNGKFIGWTHADLQTDPYDLVVASRLVDNHTFVKGKRYGRPLLDSLLSNGMSIFESLLFSKILFEINAQPTLFPRNFFEELKDLPKDFSLDLYIYLKAKKNKLKVKRFSVHFGKREFGKSSWNTGLKARLNFIMRTIKYSLHLRNKGF